ncbi:Rep protein [Escherichia coli]|nr:Rep protein [Escherichia coli]
MERALCEKLGADVNYSGLICKNPCHPEWQEVEWREEPYTLDELADYLDLSASARRSVDKNYGLGRNYHLFEKVRKWAYRAIRQGWPVFSQWLDAVIQRVEMYNAARGRKGGTKSKRAAVPTSARSLKPWEALGISRATYYRKLKCDPDLAK